MDIFEYIDRVKANFDKQPEPRYNMKKYFMGGLATPKRGLVDEPGSYAGKSGAEKIREYNKKRMREYRLKNPRPFKVTEIVADGVKYSIPNKGIKPDAAKGLIKFLNKLEKNPSVENYRELVRGIDKKDKSVGNAIRDYRYFLQGEKEGSFATGSGTNKKEFFEKIKSNLPKKSTNFLSKVTPKEIKGQIMQTGTKTAGKIKKATSMRVVNAVRDIFVNDPNKAPDLDDIAKGLEGFPQWNAANESEKIKMRTRASNGVKQFLEAVTADRKVKGFKDIAPETLGEIIQYIDDNKRGQFRFAEGLIRDYKIKLRDSILGEDFAKKRRDLPSRKGKVIDEVFGLSATFEDAPGYTENIQYISDEANKLKRTQIDNPFAAIFKAIKNGRDTVTFDKQRDVPISEAIRKFNAKSKVFSNVNKISTPQIFVGSNLDATKLVSNFDKYSLGAQKNIKQLAKQGFILNATKPATPVGTFYTGSKLKEFGKPSAMKELMSRTSMGIDPTLLPKAAYQELIKPAAGVAGKAVNVGLGPTGVIGLNYALGVNPKNTVDRIGLEAEAALAPTLVKGVTSVTDKIKNPLLRKGLETLAGVRIPGIMNPTNALRIARVASPIGLATLAGEGLYQAGKYGIKRRKELQEMSPEQLQELKSKSDDFAFNEFSAASGGIASGPPPEKGPQSQGLAYLMKNGKR